MHKLEYAWPVCNLLYRVCVSTMTLWFGVCKFTIMFSRKLFISMAQTFNYMVKMSQIPAQFLLNMLLLCFEFIGHLSVHLSLMLEAKKSPSPHSNALWSFILSPGEPPRCIIVSAHSTVGNSQLTPMAFSFLSSAVCFMTKGAGGLWVTDTCPHTDATGHLVLDGSSSLHHNRIKLQWQKCRFL